MSQDKDAIIAHYRALLAEHGSGAKVLQYADDATQAARYDVLCGIARPLGSVLDVGCGLAHLHRYLRGLGDGAGYLGVDIVPEFVEIARDSLADDPLADAALIDGQDALPTGYDYALLSGVFNNAMDDNWGFATTTLRRMWAAADKGIAFNAMTSHVDYFDPGLWYVDPMKMFEFCKRDLGGHPVLRHDYTLRPGGFPFEFAMYVYKSPRASNA